MAQLRSFLPGATTPRRADTSAIQGQLAVEPDLRAADPIAGVTSPEYGQLTGGLVRPKMRGLGQGERRLLRVAADWCVVSLCVLLIFSSSSRDYSRSSILFSLGVVTLLWFFFTDTFDTYKPGALSSKSYSIYNLAQVLAAVGVSYVIVSWFVGGFLPVIRPRISEVFMALLVLFPLIFVRSLLGLLLSHNTLRRRVAVVGANQDGREMVAALMGYENGTYRFVGCFDDGTPESDEASTPGGWDQAVRPVLDMLALQVTSGLDQIILANPRQTGALLQTLSICHERGAQITPMFAIYQDLTGRVPIAHLGQDWYVALPANVKRTTRPYLLFKRLFDITLASLGLLLALPVLPIVALAIKLDSPGPVFFSQERVGLGGKPFRIRKFRSMGADAEAVTGAIWAARGDSRVTRFGRFLRKSRLDEIPQLWNVLVGDMSFVGPRHERPEFDEALERTIPFYRARRAVRPGLTGWAQIRHGYGNTITDTRLKVEYDLYYIKNQGLYLDALIMLRTVGVVFRLRGL